MRLAIESLLHQLEGYCIVPVITNANETKKIIIDDHFKTKRLNEQILLLQNYE